MTVAERRTAAQAYARACEQRSRERMAYCSDNIFAVAARRRDVMVAVQNILAKRFTAWAMINRG